MRLTPTLRRAALAATLLAGPWANARAAADITIGLMHDDNLSRATDAADVRSDSWLEAGAAFSRPLDLRGDWTVTPSVSVRGQRYAHFTGLDNVAFGAGLSAWRKLGLGLTAPWISASANVARLEFRDELRSGWRADLGASIGRRLGRDLSISGDLRLDRRIADREERLPPWFPGNAFDVGGLTASLAAGYAPAEGWLLNASLAHRRGDVTSTGVHTQAIWDASMAWAHDHALGNDAYRIDARTTMASLDCSYAIDSSTSLDLALDRWISHASGGFDYYNTVVRVVLVRRIH